MINNKFNKKGKKKAKKRKLKFRNCGVVIQKVVVTKLGTCWSYDFFQSQKGKTPCQSWQIDGWDQLKLQLTNG